MRVTLPNGTELTSSVFAADCTLTLKANADGGVDLIIPADGEVTLKSSFTVSAKDLINLGKDAVLVGTGSNSLTVNGSITGDINNFYASDGTTPEKPDEGTTYTWTTDKWVANA